MKELNESNYQDLNATPENEDLINDDAAQPDVPLSKQPDIDDDIEIAPSFFKERFAAKEYNFMKKDNETEMDRVVEPFSNAGFDASKSSEDSLKDLLNDVPQEEIPATENSTPEWDVVEKEEVVENSTKDFEDKVVVAAMPHYSSETMEQPEFFGVQEDKITDEDVITVESAADQEVVLSTPEASLMSDEVLVDDQESLNDEIQALDEEMEVSFSEEALEPSKHESTQTEASHPRKLWDILLSVVLLGVTCFFLYRLYTISILSFDWIWKIALVSAVIELALFLTVVLCHFPSWALWLRRIFICLLCGVFAFAGITINNLQNSLQDITQPETATTVNVSLITKKDGGAKLLSELSGKKIGIQTANDAANSSYVREQLDKESELEHVTYVEGLDYESLYKKLINEEIDALIITDYYFKTLLKEDYKTIEDDIFILKSYQKKKEINLSTSNKDIRYEPFTVYIAGVDEGDDPSIDARSDVNIVLIVNPLANHIEMVSIPRDSFVPNPALYGNSDKLTHLGLNGVENSMKGLEMILGFEIDYYVKLNFFSVIDIVDAIGEIEVDVPVSFCEQDENRSFAKKDLICLNKGVQHVDGKQALAFARHRKSYTDVMRGKAQQEVIKGIINELTTPGGVANINNILKIASNTISTNMPMEQVTNFVSAQIDHLKPWTIDSIILENGVDARLVTASMPGQELYVMLLNRLDIQKVYETYQSMLNQMQFSAFTFHLDHLSKETHELPNAPGIVWAGSNISSYLLSQPQETPNASESAPSESEPEPEPAPEEPTPDPEPDNPDLPVPPENDPSPSEPQDPTPDVPEDPTPSTPN